MAFSASRCVSMEWRALAEAFAAQAPACTAWSLRFVERRERGLSVRSGVCLPVTSGVDHGVMVTVHDAGGEGYAATADLTPSGLVAAAERARGWARQGQHLVAADPAGLPQGRGEWAGPCAQDPETVGIAGLIDRCVALEAGLRTDQRVVESLASLRWWRTNSLIIGSDGAEWLQTHHGLVPYAAVSVHADGRTQTRSLGMHLAAQGGLELLEPIGYDTAAPRLVSEAIELLEAEPCPEDRRDLLLSPTQMVLQIHESIGHPLELDRILGDERNYAGTSFVTPDMFGSYRYGSDLLNVTFDPTVAGQLASCAGDDTGAPAERVHLIRDGLLERPLGGRLSQVRAGLPGTANTRASSWNRPPIDRMGNINLEPDPNAEPGGMAALIAATERGVVMDTNRSWSIDDSRNKFQFGCEYARLITDGELGPVVRDPGYRAISATFWRSLVGVGGADARCVYGTPNCGKGEPNQLITTGHASPPCRFADIEVFGGA